MQPATVIHGRPRPSTTSHYFAAITQDHQWPGMILPPLPMISHNFNPKNPRPVIIAHPRPTITHNQPFFTATTHNHPRPTIIKSPLPTNNDSLATALLAITNSELYFYSCLATIHPAEFQEQCKFIRKNPTKHQEVFFFKKLEQFSLTNYVLLM